MEIFISNTSIKDIMDVGGYILNYPKGNQVFLEENLPIVKLFKFNEDSSYIGGETLDGCIVMLRVSKNTKEGLNLEVLDKQPKYFFECTPINTSNAILDFGPCIDSEILGEDKIGLNNSSNLKIHVINNYILKGTK